MTVINHLQSNWRELAVCFLGGVVGAFLTYTLFIDQPVTDPYDTDYHIHADFVVYLRGERLDLAQQQYMTSAEQSLHDDVHLHDDVGDVVHYHAPEVTFSEFLSSLGYTLTNDCFITSSGEQFCNNDTETLQLYVNDKHYSGDISAYVPADLDRILIHFGDEADPKLADYLREVEDKACIYSGSCPERGVAPAESCGLTCEL